jgi:MFS family permease
MAGETTQHDNPRQVRPVYALTLLALASFMNYLDRMVLPAVAQPIKLEFGLSDSELGLLTGFAFVLLYALSGVPLSRLADRSSRPLVLALSLAFWSVATLRGRGAQLLATAACARLRRHRRVDVPAGRLRHRGRPLRRDTRTTAIAWFLVGNSLGVTAASRSAAGSARCTGGARPLSRSRSPGCYWRSPSGDCRRPCERRLRPADPAGAGFWSDLRSLWSRRPYRWLIGLNAVYSCTLFGPIAWLPTFFMRSHELPCRWQDPGRVSPSAVAWAAACCWVACSRTACIAAPVIVRNGSGA